MMKFFGLQVKKLMSSFRRPQQNGSAGARAMGPINADGLSVSAYTLGIIYSLIARGNVILSHYACCHGNFSEVALQVIKNIELDCDGKLTYAAGEYVLSLSLSLFLPPSFPLSPTLNHSLLHHVLYSPLTYSGTCIIISVKMVLSTCASQTT